jgi:hypothetical protein
VFEVCKARSDGAIRASLFFAAPKFDGFAEPVIGRPCLRVPVACNDGLRILGRGCLKRESESRRRAEARRMFCGRLGRAVVAARAMTSALLSLLFAEIRLSQLRGKSWLSNWSRRIAAIFASVNSLY